MRMPEPIRTEHLFAPLHEELMALLRSLSAAEWSAPTVAGAWTVKDVAAHLLDTAIRRLSMQRDGHTMSGPFDPRPFDPNAANREWVSAAGRLSPRILIEMLDRYGRENAEYLASLDPFAKAQWGVTWAGEEESPVWFDVARELTERWHHQQQIRDAVGRAPLHEPYLGPVLATFVRALPFTYRDVDAPDGTAIVFNDWSLVRDGGWTLHEGRAGDPVTAIEIDPAVAWRVFTKQQIDPQAVIEGDARYAEPLLRMVTVIG
ncbi:MAG TPA: maleylpyruvate isomerase N-terminal domain-containing protein [Thermoanaerobaculia bacterium]|nr:maleylpyruvate isomerase N-terminal domain-containing protein [Thermoanaerobaculia bacterium]